MVIVVITNICYDYGSSLYPYCPICQVRNGYVETTLSKVITICRTVAWSRRPPELQFFEAAAIIDNLVWTLAGRDFSGDCL